ncbi:unannotated protein [freshwater metagenome]|uniref:Unannotated protein n=1 Tax=freshwater metagenome TaxID=449393 RepID=A0A6J7RUH8_9ZZZZ
MSVFGSRLLAASLSEISSDAPLDEIHARTKDGVDKSIGVINTD